MLVYEIVADHAIDQRVADLLREKREAADRTVELATTNPEVAP